MNADRVLIVEPDAAVSRSLAEALVACGYDVCVPVSSVHAARVALAGETPDLVVLGARLSDAWSALQAAETLRQDHEIPVIVVADAENAATPAAMARWQQHQQPWWHAVVRSIRDGIVAVRVDGTIQYANPAAEELLSQPVGHLVGRRAGGVIRTVDEATGEPLESAIRQCLRTRTVVRRGRTVLRLAAADRPISETASPILSESGELLGAVTVLRDEKSTRLAERRLAAARQLSAVGVVASGLVNELEGPIGLVRANLEFVRDQVLSRVTGVPEVEMALAALADAAYGIDRVDKILQDIGSYGQSRPSDPIDVDLRQVVTWAIDVAGADLRAANRLITDLRSVPLVHADPALLRQVVLNVLLGTPGERPEREAKGVVRIATFGEDGRAVLEVEDDRPLIDDNGDESRPDRLRSFSNAVSEAIVRSMGGRIRLGVAPTGRRVTRVVINGTYPDRRRQIAPARGDSVAQGPLS